MRRAAMTLGFAGAMAAFAAPAAVADLKFAEVASCSGSAMWESIGVE